MILSLLLGCTPPSTAPPLTPPPPVEEEGWVALTANPCAQWSDGYVYCWFDERRMAVSIPNSPWPVGAFRTDSVNAVGVREDGLMMSWGCGEGWGGANCLPPWGIEADLKQIAWSEGLLEDGSLFHWGGSGWTRHPGVRFRLIRSISQTTLLSFDNVLYLDRFAGPILELDLGERQVLDIAGIGQRGCVLYADGEIECYGDEVDEVQYPGLTASFDSPPYQMIAAGAWNICAVREDWDIECNNGEVYNFGPIRELAVGTYYTRINRPAGFDWSPYDPFNGMGLCVILEDGQLDCVGPTYSNRFVDEVLGTRPARDTGTEGL